MRIVSACAACVALGLLVGCSTAPGRVDTELRIVGSDTMLILNRRLAEGYMRENPGISIRVEGGGSAEGIRMLASGAVRIAAVSRPLLPTEVEAIHQQFGTLGVRFLIAGDALSVFVNDANNVRSLTVDQLRGLFDGSIRSWSAVEGAGGEVVVVVRPPGSGSHRFFRDRVLKGGSYAADATTVPSTLEVINLVRSDPRAIGYGGVAYRSDGVRGVLLDGVDPSQMQRQEARYPLSRHLALITAQPPSGLARRFIDWCMEDEGQAIVAEVGYIPLWRK